MEKLLLTLYQRMYEFFGPLNWWPGESRSEVIIGAILTQNTAWVNVEKAIDNLKEAQLLDWQKLRRVEEERLAQLIRPSGYYNQKAKKLRTFAEFLEREYAGSLDKLAAEPLEIAREKLLAVHGIGPETADSILLYALQKPIIVVDAYTRRIFSRHGFFPQEYTYQQIQQFMMEHVPPGVPLFNEYHAQIVYTGKTFCKTKPTCAGCPLEGLSNTVVA